VVNAAAGQPYRRRVWHPPDRPRGPADAALRWWLIGRRGGFGGVGAGTAGEVDVMGISSAESGGFGGFAARPRLRR